MFIPKLFIFVGEFNHFFTLRVSHQYEYFVRGRRYVKLVIPISKTFPKIGMKLLRRLAKLKSSLVFSLLFMKIVKSS